MAGPKYCYNLFMDNDKTIESYEANIDVYNQAAVPKIWGSVKDWADTTLKLLPPGAHVLELGSAHGRDAKYIESKGFKVDRTDAVKGFVDYMIKQGYEARVLNVLTDELGGLYDMVYANAVFLHFNQEQLKLILDKVKGSLKSNGLLAFSVKIGDGSTWSKSKIGAPRYFTYWREEPLREFLKSSGFKIEYFKEGSTGHNNSDWFHVIASVSS